MKVLRIIASMNPDMGGPCQGIRNSIPAQIKAGVHNEVVCFDAPESGFLKADDFKIHALGPAVGPYAYCGRYKKWLKEHLLEFDAVIIHGLWLYNSFGTYQVWRDFRRKKAKVPKVFLMPHGMLDPYFQRAKGRRLKALRNLLFWHLVEQRVINGTDGLLFTCERELLLARETFSRYRPKEELNVGYGIQPPPLPTKEQEREFLRRCSGVAERPFLLFLGRIHPKKGVDLLIKAYLKMKEMNKEIPDLVIAGPGLDSSYGSMLQKMVADPQIHFPGMLTGAAKWGAFYGSDAFVLPSHQENFGIAVVEAMACRKAVLISDQVNIWKEIQKGKGGLVAGDTEEGATQLLQNWLKLSPQEREQMGASSHDVYQAKFSIERAARNMVESIEHLC